MEGQCGAVRSESCQLPENAVYADADWSGGERQKEEGRLEAREAGLPGMGWDGMEGSKEGPGDGGGKRSS